MEPDVWSGLVTQFNRTERDLPARSKRLEAVIVHTTGSGIVAKALKKGEDPQEYAAAYYSGRRAYASHYLIGHDFTRSAGNANMIVGTVPENLVAYHAGVSSKVRAIYAKGRAEWPRYLKKGGKLQATDELQARYNDWLSRWPSVLGPHKLIGPGVNGRTIGVDILAPEPGNKHSELQIKWCAALVRDICERNEILVSKSTVLRHADVDPFSRTSKSGGWDPPRYAFEDLCDELGIEAWPEESSSS